MELKMVLRPNPSRAATAAPFGRVLTGFPKGLVGNASRCTLAATG